MSPAKPHSKELQQVGQLLRATRELKGISLRKFAAEIDVTPSYYSKLERGIMLAGNTTYERICEKLGLDSEEVLEKIGLVDSEFEQDAIKYYRELKGYLRRKKSREKKSK
jgi:transcriptional regulator with XRE-family HTH domain